MTKLLKNKILWLALLLLSFAVLPGRQVAADVTGSIQWPSQTTAPSGSGMVAPTIGTGSGAFTYLNWSGVDAGAATPTARYAVLQSGQTVKMYTDFNYTGSTWLNPVYYRTAVATGNGTSAGASTAAYSSGSTLQSGGNQTGVVAISDASTNYRSIGYKITAPTVTTPTWMYYQVQARGGSLGSWVGSSIFAVLVFPSGYQFAAAMNPAVVFPNTKSTLAYTSLPYGVTPSVTTAVTSGAGTWSDSTFTSAALGSGTATYGLSVSVPYPSISGTTGTNYSGSQTVYVGQIADQSVYVNDDATFSIQLPDGLTASNVTWSLAGTSVTGSGTTFTVPNTLSSYDGKTVTATMTVSKDGQVIAQNVTGTATLSVKPEPFAVSVSPQLIFSGSDVDTASGTATASATFNNSATTDVTWSGDNSSLASVNTQTGVVTANAAATPQTGTLTITGNYAKDDETRTQTTKLVVGRVATPNPVATGASFTLNSPSASGWTYQWQTKANGSDTWTTIPGATAAAYTGTAALSDDGAQYRVQVTAGSATVTSNAVTLAVNPAGLTLVQVPDFLFKHAVVGETTAQMTDPTVADLINGTYSGGTIDWNNPTSVYSDWLLPQTESPVIVSDTRTSGSTFSLSMAVSPFKTSSGNYLSTATGGTATLAMVDPTASSTQQVNVLDNNTPVTLISGASVDATTGRYTYAREPMLAIAKSPRASAGQYQSTVTWTATTGPTN
jgi:hypothetical protein